MSATNQEVQSTTLVVVCSYCQRSFVFGEWLYHDRSENSAESHGICPECNAKVRAEYGLCAAKSGQASGMGGA